jgi:hypothetical protein
MFKGNILWKLIKVEKTREWIDFHLSLQSSTFLFYVVIYYFHLLMVCISPSWFRYPWAYYAYENFWKQGQLLTKHWCCRVITHNKSRLKSSFRSAYSTKISMLGEFYTFFSCSVVVQFAIYMVQNKMAYITESHRSHKSSRKYQSVHGANTDLSIISPVGNTNQCMAQIRTCLS